jgi:hypothetical protein
MESFDGTRCLVYYIINFVKRKKAALIEVTMYVQAAGNIKHKIPREIVH